VGSVGGNGPATDSLSEDCARDPAQGQLLCRSLAGYLANLVFMLAVIGLGLGYTARPWTEHCRAEGSPQSQVYALHKFKVTVKLHERFLPYA